MALVGGCIVLIAVGWVGGELLAMAWRKQVKAHAYAITTGRPLPGEAAPKASAAAASSQPPSEPKDRSVLIAEFLENPSIESDSILQTALEATDPRIKAALLRRFAETSWKRGNYGEPQRIFERLSALGSEAEAESAIPGMAQSYRYQTFVHTPAVWLFLARHGHKDALMELIRMLPLSGTKEKPETEPALTYWQAFMDVSSQRGTLAVCRT